MGVTAKIRRLLRGMPGRRAAYGGPVQGPPPWDDDRVGVLIMPGYVSYDNGRTWHEVP